MTSKSKSKSQVLKKSTALSYAQKEHSAELLKERIYATLALLAVLLSINTNTTSPLNVLYIVIGTIFSLWAASIVSTQISRRVVFENELDANEERAHQLRRHAPLLASLVFPTLMLSLAATHLISLETAVNFSIASALLLLVGWSIASARSLRLKKFPTLVIIAAELLIGMAIVTLKIVVGH